MNNENKDINWEKWGVIVAVIFGLLTLFGITFNCESCFTGSNTCSQTIINVDDETENLPTEEEIKEQIQEKTNKVWIEDMTVYHHEAYGYYKPEYFLGENVTDNIGNSYSHSLLMTFDDGWAVGEKNHTQEINFYLDNKYDSFVFTLASDKETKDTKKTIRLSIYADDEKIWSGNVAGNTLPKTYNLDVSNTTSLKIEGVVDYGYGGDSNAIFGDAHFTIAE